MSTATKTARSNRFKSYDDLIKHTDKPLANRRELKIGRGGVAVVPRKFHLSEAEIAALTETYKSEKRFPNPHNKGFYFYLVEALVQLGINEAHSLPTVHKKVEALMSDESTIEGEGKDATTAWDRFTQKDPRNAETGKDWESRFDQNITVLQRLTGLTPYGRKILEVGQKVMGKAGGVIDLLVGPKGGKSLMLNTRSATPRNESKVRGMGSLAQIEADKAARREAKANAAEAPAPKAKRASKPKVEKTEATDNAPAASEMEAATA